MSGKSAGARGNVLTKASQFVFVNALLEAPTEVPHIRHEGSQRSFNTLTTCLCECVALPGPATGEA